MFSLCNSNKPQAPAERTITGPESREDLVDDLCMCRFLRGVGKLGIGVSLGNFRVSYLVSRRSHGGFRVDT